MLTIAMLLFDHPFIASLSIRIGSTLAFCKRLSELLVGCIFSTGIEYLARNE